MPLEVSDIEFSDDMFVLTAAEARKQVEPSMLTRIEVRPDSAQVEPGKSLSFGSRGIDQHGLEMPLADANWTATGGQVVWRGVYRAADTPGEYVVTVASGTSFQLGSCLGRRTTQPDDPERCPPLLAHGQIRWSGSIPAQKWMQFYTKVLAKFANSGGLTVNVDVVIGPDGGVSRQQAEEIQSALRETRA